MTTLGYKHSEETKQKIGRANAIALKGRKMPESVKAKIRKKSIANGNRPPTLKGKDSPSWKGNNILYGSLHDWVRRWKGHAPSCEGCGVKGKKSKGHWTIHWANKDRKYKRNLEDWIGLCRKCHYKHDKK